MSMDMNMVTLINTIRKIAMPPQKDNMIFGEVKNIDPLEIDIGNNIVLSGKFLYLGQMCRPHKVKIPHTHILDTHFTEVSPSLGNIGGGAPSGELYEQTYSAIDSTTMNTYKTLNDEGDEQTNQISNADLGRGAIQTSIVGQVTDTSVMITDNGHKHIIPKQITKDVHFPKSDYEESITIEIEPKLAVGDTVLMFAMNNNQCYYVAERVEKEEE